MQNLTTSEYWTSKHPEIVEHIVGDGHHNVEYLFPLLDRHVHGASTVFEVGCVPGQGLLKFARRYACVPSGSDFCDELRVTEAVLTREAPGGQFFHHDIGSESVEGLGQYDVVLSGGLIEHFADPAPVIRKHIELLRPGGLLVLNTPNLHVVRASVWRAFDPVLYAAHNPRATSRKGVSEMVARAGGEVIESGYFGDPHFWLEHDTSRRNRIGHRVTALMNSAAARTTWRGPIAMPFVYWLARRA